ncbi:hypothetical protein RHMOL_Rhmol10G0225800 [Rhododendron molle]|uniref:Uncharacterized protein n=1 Tax=Rhododendron molle TaxID=49168 RepID=A0ACC0M4Z9_RHOML|nr:hypothetical protein RHMOL_Rhmol10G0225800 [Rhododendron molle]
MPRAAPRNSRRGITVGVKLLVSLDGGQGGNDAGLRGYDENSSSLVDHFNFQDKGGSGLGHIEENTAVLLGKWWKPSPSSSGEVEEEFLLVKNARNLLNSILGVRSNDSGRLYLLV